MDSVREKLVELFRNAFAAYGDGIAGCTREEFFADFIAGYGVTVQETGHWASLTDCSNKGVYCSVCHKKVYKEDYAWCNRKNKLRSDYCPNCGAKMMPQPLKGE